MLNSILLQATAVAGYRFNRLYASCNKPCYAYDTSACYVLWWFGNQAKHSGNYDSEFRFTGLDNCSLGYFWLLTLL